MSIKVLIGTDLPNGYSMSAQPSIYVENEPYPVESVEISDPDAMVQVISKCGNTLLDG
jgi:hypothetical protein